MEKPVKERLKEKMKERGIKIPVLAEQTNIPKGRIYGWYRDNSNPKSEDLQKLEQWIAGESFMKSKENVPREKEQNDTLKDSSLIGLIASNDKLAQANLELAQAHTILARNNEELISRSKTTADAHEYVPLADPANVLKLLEVLAELGAPKLWKTKSDGLILLGNYFAVPEHVTGKMARSLSAADKKSIAKGVASR